MNLPHQAPPDLLGPLADPSLDDAHGVLTMIFDMSSTGQGLVL